MSFAGSQLNAWQTVEPDFSGTPQGPTRNRLATRLFLLYLFLVMSRGVELISMATGLNLRLSLVLMIVCFLAALVTGGLLNAVKTPVVVMFIILTCWLMLCTLTSQWRGGSVATLIIWATSFGCALILPSLISTLDDCRKACYVLGFSLIPILLITVFYQGQLQGREGSNFGTFSNPNDLAFSLIVLMPFAVFVISSESATNWKTIVCLGALGFGMVKTLRTGSRGGLLGILTATIVVFLVGKSKTKVKILIGAVLIFAIAIAFIPDNVLRRYGTVFNGTSYEADMSADERSAVESSRSRKMLFEESIRVMLEHPFFGVGPGIFSAALAKEQEQRGEFQTWHEAHNTFTQLGSEAGVPALVIYIAIVIYCLKRTVSIFRQTRRDPNQLAISRMAATLSMAILVFAICASFGTYSYTLQLPVLAGLVQAFDVCVRRQMNKAPVIAAAVSPAPQPAAPVLKPRVPSYVRHRRLRDSRT